MKNSGKRYRNQYDCAHAWAHGNSGNGRASSLYFDGPIIYSYGSHFPIAMIDGIRVYFTKKSYSSTTAKHKSIVLSAASHLDFIFVQHLPGGNVPPKSDTYFIQRNIDHWETEIQRLMEDFRLYPRRTSLLLEIKSTYRTLSKFIGVMGATPSALVGELAEKMEAEIFPALKAVSDRRILRRSKTPATREEAYAKALDRWRRNKRKQLNIPHPSDRNLTFLRLNLASEAIDTSKNVRVAITDAKNLYRYIRDFLVKESVLPEFEIKGFQVAAIDQDYLTIGCHKIPMEEVDAIAERMGWKKESP